MLPFDVWPSFPVNASFVPILARQSYSRLNVLSRLHFFRSFSAVFNCRSWFNEAAYLAALRRLRSPFAIRDWRRLETIKDENIWNNHLLLRISAVIGRCGPHLMIVVIFVTQNNFFWNGPGISNHFLGFYHDFLSLYFVFDFLLFFIYLWGGGGGVEATAGCKKKYCTYSITFVNRKKNHSFVSLRPDIITVLVDWA